MNKFFSAGLALLTFHCPFLPAGEPNIEWKETFVYVSSQDGKKLLKVKALKPVSDQYAAFTFEDFFDTRKDPAITPEWNETLYYTGYRKTGDPSHPYIREKLSFPDDVLTKIRQFKNIDENQRIMGIGDYYRRFSYQFEQRVPIAQNKGNIYYFLETRDEAQPIILSTSKGNIKSVDLDGIEARNGKVPVIVHLIDQSSRSIHELGIADVKSGKITSPGFTGNNFWIPPAAWINDHLILGSSGARHGTSFVLYDLFHKTAFYGLFELRNTDTVNFISDGKTIWYSFPNTGLHRFYPYEESQAGNPLQISVALPSKKDSAVYCGESIRVTFKNAGKTPLKLLTPKSGGEDVALWYSPIESDSDPSSVEWIISPPSEDTGNLLSESPYTNLAPGEGITIDIPIELNHFSERDYQFKVVYTNFYGEGCFTGSAESIPIPITFSYKDRPGN